MPKKSTLVVFTPSGPTPSYLYRLRQANINIEWIGKYEKFVNMQSPSTRYPWSSAMLVEGDLVRRGPKWLAPDDWVEFPDSLLPLQSWSFTIEEDGVSQDLPQGNERRFCVWNFVTCQTEEGEKRYREYLAADGMKERKNAMDMKVHFRGRLISSETSLATEAAKLNKASPVKPSETSTVNSPEPFRQSQSRSKKKNSKMPDPINHAILLSFPSRNEWEHYLSWDERKALGELGVEEGFIECTQKDLPSKDAAYSEFRQFGHEIEPFGQDWFG